MSAPAAEHAQRDAAARHAAVREFDRSLILEAGAGTGKTAILVERVVTWCVGPGFDRTASANECGDRGVAAERVLDGVVALTFSEAGAAEMHERVARRLVEVARGEAFALEGLQAGATGEVAPRARALLANLDRLGVRTIHAFCRSILARFPIEAGLHPRFRVDARAELRARVAREEIEALLQSDRSGDRAALAALSECGVGAPDLERLLVALLGSNLTPECVAENPLAPAKLTDWWQRLAALHGACTTATVQNAIGVRLAEALAATQRSLTAPAPANLDEFTARLEALRGIWEPVDGALRTAGARDSALAALRRFLHVAFRSSPRCAAPLHAVLAPRFAAAAQRLRAEGGTTFDALLLRTRHLLFEHADVAHLVRRSIAQLLIDEFQDTDPVQCDIAAQLALQGKPSERPVLFVVGDPKQSIYGWRNADLAAYDRFVSEAVQRGAERHVLVVNHRSCPALLDEVERAIAPVMVRRPGVQPAFQPLLPSPGRLREAGPAGTPAVEYWVSSSLEGGARPGEASRARELEAEAIAADLLRAHAEARHRPHRWGSAAILLRSTGDLEHYLEALRRCGIPFAVDRDRIYYRRREVLEAAALLRTVLDPNDQLALVATLRSVRCGVPDAAWLPLWRAGFPGAVRHALISSEVHAVGSAVAAAVRAAHSEVETLTIAGLDALHAWHEGLLDFVALLVALRRSYQSEAFDRFLERARRLALFDPSEAARHLGAHRLANLDRFFREVARCDDAVAGDTAALLRVLRRGEPVESDFDEGRPRDVNEDAVAVMTIHGAKGLAFDCVYLAQAHKGSSAVPQGPIEAQVRGGHAEYRLRWGPGRQQVMASLGFDRVVARRERVARAELVRTLYVAMTRARNRLVLVGRFDAAAADRGETHADLLAKSLGRDLARARQLAAQNRSAEATVGGRRFRFLAAAEPPLLRWPDHSGSSPENLVREAQLASQRTLVTRRAARVHASRPFSGAPSAAAVREPDETVRSSDHRAGEGGARGALTAGARVGSAVHSFLEHFDWHGDETRSWALQWERTRARLIAQTSSRERAATLARAEAVLETFRGGPLWPRLRGLTPFVLAREVPVLAPADGAEDGPVGYWAGTIDLVYRDPANEEVVVADFKTDRATPRLVSAAEGYRGQGAVYCRAVADALGLRTQPRFELWFLDAHEVVVLR